MGIKAVVFDIGGVLISEPGFLARDIIAKKYNIDPRDFEEYARKNLSKSHKGELDAEIFFKGLIDELSLDVEPSALVEDWLSAREKLSKIDNVVKETIDKLAKNYLLGVLSDSTCLNEKASARKNCYAPFDFKIISCEVGAEKPTREIYEILVKELGGRDVKLEEAIFIDNEEENLVPARELGIKTILFEDAEQMIRDLRELGVDI